MGSSIQISLPDFSKAEIRNFIERCGKQGVELKWFGDNEPRGFTSRYDSWQYIREQADLPVTSRVLSTLCDLRIPLTFDEPDCLLIGELIEECVRKAHGWSQGRSYRSTRPGRREFSSD